MTVVVAGYIDLENADHRDALIESARPYIEGAWAERGCIAYAFTPDPFNPNRIQVFEEWVEEQDLSDHLVGKPYLDMLGHLRGAGISGAKTQKYRVDLIEPIYDETGTPRGDFFTAK